MGFCPEGDTNVNPVVKYMLLIGCFVHWVCGAAITSLGIWAYVEKDRYFYQPIESAYDVILDLSIILMVTGTIIFLVTGVGFVGALRENVILLRIYIVASSIIFALEVVGGILTFVFKNDAIETLRDVFKEHYVINYHDRESGIIDYFQETLGCCGIEGYRDYNENEYFDCSATIYNGLKCAVPYSCCRNQMTFAEGVVNMFCGADALKPNSQAINGIYTAGCMDLLLLFLEKQLPIIGGVTFGILFIQLLGMLLALALDGQIEGWWNQYYEKKRQKRILREQYFNQIINGNQRVNPNRRHLSEGYLYPNRQPHPNRVVVRKHGYFNPVNRSTNIRDSTQIPTVTRSVGQHVYPKVILQRRQGNPQLQPRVVQYSDWKRFAY